MLKDLIFDMQMLYIHAEVCHKEIGGDVIFESIFKEELEKFSQKEAEIEVGYFEYEDNLDYIGAYSIKLDRVKVDRANIYKALCYSEVDDVLDVIDTYCHECFHAWQVKKGNYDFSSYFEISNYDDYNNHPFEIEARNFASSIIKDEAKMEKLLSSIIKQMESLLAIIED